LIGAFKPLLTKHNLNSFQEYYIGDEANKSPVMFFDPDDHPDNTHNAVNEFTQMFEVRYNAQYPNPPRVSLDAAMQRLLQAVTKSKTHCRAMTEHGVSGDSRIE